MLRSTAEQLSLQLLLGQYLDEYLRKKKQPNHQEEKCQEKVQLEKAIDTIIQANPIVTRPLVESKVTHEEVFGSIGGASSYFFSQLQYSKDFQGALWQRIGCDPCNFLVGLFELGRFDEAKYACWRLLVQGVFIERKYVESKFVSAAGEIVWSVTPELVRGMLNPQCWLKKRFHVQEIGVNGFHFQHNEKTILLKENVLKIIHDLQDKKLKQQAFWQALFPQTLLGNIFHIERNYRYSSPPNIEHGYLNKIVKCLAEQLTGKNSQQEIFIDCHTLSLLRKDKELQSSLKDSVPELYERIHDLLYPVVDRITRITDDKHSPSPELREKIISSDHCVNIGLLSHREDKLEKAIAAYDEATELDPQNFYPYYYRALAYGQQGGHLDKAIQDCEKAISLISDSEGSYRFYCYRMLSYFYYHNRQDIKAQGMIDKLLSGIDLCSKSDLAYEQSILYWIAKRNQKDEKEEVGRPGLVDLFDIDNFRNAQHAYLRFIQGDTYKSPLWPSSRYLKNNFLYYFPESRAELVEMILDEKLWPQNNEQRNDIEKVAKEAEKCKERTLELILSLKDQELQQRAFWQALVPETLLGNIFYIKRGVSSPSIASGYLEEIVQHLEEIFKNPSAERVIDEKVLSILKEKKNMPLQRELSQHYPRTFSKIGLFRAIEMHTIKPIASASSSTLQPLAATKMGR